MSIGPVQLIVLGFEHPEFHGEIIAVLVLPPVVSSSGQPGNP